MSSLARRLFSSSVTYVRRSTGTHVHRIDGYSFLAQSSAPGDAVRSKPFHIGGHKFQLLLYPNGISADHRGSISVDLKLAYNEFNDYSLPERWHKAVATYRVSFLDDDGNLARSRTVGRCCFLTPKYRRTFERREDEDVEVVMRKTSVNGLVAAHELVRRSALGNDCLKVQCDVSVLDTDSGGATAGFCDLNALSMT